MQIVLIEDSQPLPAALSAHQGLTLMEGCCCLGGPVFKVHAKFMMRRPYVLYTSAHLRGRPGGAQEGDEPLAAFSDNLIFSPSRNLRCCNGNSGGEFPVNRVRPCSWMRLLGPIILILSESLESQWEQNVKTCVSRVGRAS